MSGALVLPGKGTPSVPDLGVAIAPTKSGAHVGVCFRDEHGDLRVLHLATHHVLQNQKMVEVAGKFAVAASDIPKPRAMAVSVFLGYIWERCGASGITYGLLYKGPSFGSDGSLRLPEGTIGLTCSTFVISALASANVQLLRHETWRQRDDDAAMQSAIVSDMESVLLRWEHESVELRRRSDLPPPDGLIWQAHLKKRESRARDLRDRIAALRTEIGAGATRFRPEEVAQAVISPYTGWPLSLDQVEESARLLMEQVRGSCPVFG